MRNGNATRIVNYLGVYGLLALIGSLLLPIVGKEPPKEVVFLAGTVTGIFGGVLLPKVAARMNGDKPLMGEDEGE